FPRRRLLTGPPLSSYHPYTSIFAMLLVCALALSVRGRGLRLDGSACLSTLTGSADKPADLDANRIPTPPPHPRTRAPDSLSAAHVRSPPAPTEPLMPAVQDAVSGGIDTTALLTALTALKKGNYSVRLPVEWTGVAGKVADTFNEVVELNERMARELERL